MIMSVVIDSLANLVAKRGSRPGGNLRLREQPQLPLRGCFNIEFAEYTEKESGAVGRTTLWEAATPGSLRLGRARAEGVWPVEGGTKAYATVGIFVGARGRVRRDAEKSAAG